MSIRAAIFDVYGTLLEVGPAPADADARWQKLWRELLQNEPSLSLVDFSIAASHGIARHQEKSRKRGVMYPEVNWPAIVREIVPQLRRLTPALQEEFIYRHIQTSHTTRLTQEAAAALRRLTTSGCLLGIASNAQQYTLRELQQELSRHDLAVDIFNPALCFWSFQHGFSKPDPHVFQILTARLEALNIGESETIMVGDRLDNDIAPARAHGWQTWRLATPGRAGDGSLIDLLATIDRNNK